MEKRAGTLKLFSVIGAALVGLSVGGIFLGLIVHEESHAVACLLFRVPITSWSLDHVVFERSSNNFVNVSIGLAGGLGQALGSLIFFLCARYYLVQVGTKTVFQRLLQGKRSMLPSIIFGFELSFLAIAFHGVINGVVEGFFYEVYIEIHSNSSIWLGVLALCIIAASFILYSRQGKYLRM